MQFCTVYASIPELTRNYLLNFHECKFQRPELIIKKPVKAALVGDRESLT